jgi:hypothetical protein
MKLHSDRAKARLLLWDLFVTMMLRSGAGCKQPSIG